MNFFNRDKVTLMAGGAVAAMLTAAALVASTANAAPPGDAAPAFKEADASGKQVQLSDFAGKQAVVYVTYAIDAGKTLDKLVRIVESRGAEVLGGLQIRRDDLEGGAAAIGPLAGADYDPDFGDLAAGASTTKTYEFLATGGVNADANVFLRGDTPDEAGEGTCQIY